jgi:hypothetical protein
MHGVLRNAKMRPGGRAGKRGAHDDFLALDKVISAIIAFTR